MIFIGNDIVEISRIKKTIDNYKDSFLNKIFSEEEIGYCINKASPEIHFAGKFAAKESVFKAIMQYDSSINVYLKDITIINDKDLKPYVEISDKILLTSNIQISISHTNSYATSVALLYL